MMKGLWGYNLIVSPGAPVLQYKAVHVLTWERGSGEGGGEREGSVTEFYMCI